ncbi:MAG: ACP S-malonyltransferase [Bacteroidales bacterium]|nr:ACP S-malonyltransferase [Bacteroidales bacterium]
MKAFVFPGQGAQFTGMGKDLYDNIPLAKEMFEKANKILGWRISDIMFTGSADELKQTKVTQPSIFIHSVILAKCLAALQSEPQQVGEAFATKAAEAGITGFAPDMVAGHSLGEFSALTAAGALSFEEGLTLVSKRAFAMQKACELKPSTMAAVLGLENKIIEDACAEVTASGIAGVVVAANYNSNGQVVISGDIDAVAKAGEALKAAGARRVLPLAVGGAFHSPLMDPARVELAEAIERAIIVKPICPVYQNVDAMPHSEPEEIIKNLLIQLTNPVKWAQIVEKMVADGADEFVELGPGTVLQGLVRKLSPAESKITGLQ